MKKWVELILRFPLLTAILLGVVTLVAFFGLLRIRFDTSTEAMMPKKNIIYKQNQRAKSIFGDSSTSVLTALRPKGKHPLFCRENFKTMYQLVSELEEYSVFNREVEEARLKTLLETGNVSIKKKGSLINVKESTPGEIDDLESQLDREIFGEGDNKKSSGKTRSGDIWDLSRPLRNNTLYPRALRERNVYRYGSYNPVSIRTLKQRLSPAGVRQLETVIIRNSLTGIDEGRLLTRNEFKKIIESWESVFLYKSMRIIKALINPVTGKDINGDGNKISLKSFLHADKDGRIKLPQTQKDFDRYRALLKANPAYESVLYSVDQKGDIRALAISLVMRPLENHMDVFSYIYTAIKKYENDRVKITPVGIPVYEKFIFDYMNRDLKTLVPLVLAVIVLIFLLNFKSLRGVILPSLAVAVAVIWATGLMGYLDVPITMMVNMLPALLLSVGSSYAIHIYNQYLHDRDALILPDKKNGLASSMSHISSTVVLASLTTAIGFSTLAVNELISLKHLGIFSAVGSFFAMGIAVTLIPVCLMLLKIKKNKTLPAGDDIRRNRFVGRIIIIFDYLSQNRGRPVIFISLVLFIAGLAGTGRIKIASTPMNNFKKNSYLYNAEFMMGDYFDGSLTMNLVFDSGRKDGVNDPRFLRDIERVRNWLTSPENREKFQMLHTNAYGDYIKRIHKSINNEAPESFTIPDSRQTIEDYLKLYSGADENSDGRVDAIEPFVDSQFRYANIMIRVGSIDGRLYSSHLVEKSKRAIEKFISGDKDLKKYRYLLIGESMNFMVISQMIISGQLKSIFITLAVVVFVILFLFRNIVAGLISIIPISMAIVITYGTMGYFNIPLDISKSLLAAIAIGIGVDDTIHMLKTLKFHLHRGLSLKMAMDATYREAGTAIIYTSLALISGFSVLLFSEFLPIFYLAILMILTILMTTVSALILLPGVIFLFKLNIDRELDWKIFKIINFKKFFEIEK